MSNDEGKKPMPNDEGKKPMPNDEGKKPMPNDEGKKPMSNDEGKKPMPNDEGKGFMFGAFRNLSLLSNNNHWELGESSNNNGGNFINSNNNNQNLNFYNNFGPISLRGSRLSPVGLRAPPSTPSSWISRPGVSSSTNSGQPWASPQSFLKSDINLRRHNYFFRLFDLMVSPTLSEFLEFLRLCDNYESAERESWLLKIGRKITTNHSTFLGLALNQNGSRALRTLLKRSPGLDRLIFESVCANFPILMRSQYGRYLVAPTLRAVDKPRREILYRLTYENTLSLATTEFGCVALNEVFQEIKGRFRDVISELVANEAGWLSFDPYGTHVVQNFLKLHNPVVTRAIAQTLHGKFFELAMVRHGSYVVEKCLTSDFGREKVLEEFRGDAKKWVRMANDKYGNFVAQCALRVMMKTGMKQMLKEFVEKLRPHFWQMNVGHGKNTLRVIEEVENWLLGFPEDFPGFLS